jgi:hypothetical protein
MVGRRIVPRRTDLCSGKRLDCGSVSYGANEKGINAMSDGNANAVTGLTLSQRITNTVLRLERNAVRSSVLVRKQPEQITITRPQGRRGGRNDRGAYDFGNAISRPATVVNGVVTKL